MSQNISNTLCNPAVKNRGKEGNKLMRNKSLLINCFVLILFISMSPFYVWDIKLVYLTSIGCLFFGLWGFSKDTPQIKVLFLLFVFYLYASFHQYNNPNFFRIVFTFLPFLLYLIKTEYWIRIYEKFFLIYSISLIPSLSVYFLITFFDVDLPHHIIPPLVDMKEYDYIQYPFLVVANNIYSIRFEGYFDEPGVIGTVSGILLVVNKFNLKDWKNWPLLISGIFSFSLFFYLLLGVYVLFFGKTKYKMLFVGVVLLVFIFFATDDSVINSLVFSRLSFDNGEWVGNNRTVEQFDAYWSRFMSSDVKWIGYGRLYAELVADPGGSSYKDLIVDFGILMFGWFVMTISLFYKLLLKDKRSFLLAMLVFICLMYQRPWIFSMFGVFFIIAPAAVLSSNPDNIEK